MMSGDQLITLLGSEADDPAVVSALTAFAIRWPPELEEMDDSGERDWYVWRPSSPNGFEFGFQDEAHLRALAPHLRGSSPLVLSSICFYGVHDGVRPYTGTLPFGLLLSDSRADVRTKLAGLEAGPRSHLRDVWDTLKYRIVTEHDSHTGALDSLLVKLRLEPWPPLDEEAPPTLPTIDEMVGLFGQPWHSSPMRRVFFPLGLDACGPDIAKNGYADMRRTRGLELYFSPDPVRSSESPIRNKGAVFTSFKLYRARYQDARGWGGELPFGLELALAYPEIQRRVGRAPDAGRDGKLSGFAIWIFPAFTLHVFHNNVDNVIDCITILKPGVWEAVT